MLVGDLCSGSGAFSRSFRESGHKVIEYDIDSGFNPDRCCDILELNPDSMPDFDVILASPPCDTFSLRPIGMYWHKHTESIRMPDSKKAYERVKLVYKILWVIREIDPIYWFMENPRAGLRKVLGMPSGTVSWCQYWDNVDYRERGEPPMKPTDLWGNHPENFNYKFCGNGGECHVSAPRGSYKGTHDNEKSSMDRARIPHGLSFAIRKAVESKI